MGSDGSDPFAGLGDIFKSITDLTASGAFDFSEEQIAALSDILPFIGFAIQLKQLEAQGMMSEAQRKEAEAQIASQSGPYFEAMQQLQYDQMAHQTEMAGFQSEQARYGAEEAKYGAQSAEEYAQARAYERMSAKDQMAMNRAELLNRMGVTNYPGFDRPSSYMGGGNYFDPVKEAFS